VTTPRPTRDELRAQLTDRVRAHTRGPLAPRPRRLLLAYGYVAAVAVCAGAALGLRGVASAVVQLVGFVAVIGLLLALRRATRLVVDAPEEALDGHLVQIRGRLYLFAYQLLAAVVMAVSVCLFAFSGSGVSEPLAGALAWTAFGAALGLPVVIAAVALPDAAPPDAPRP
jgi:hypothetical protein